MTVDEVKKWYIENNKIYFASIELTQNCNFQCKHCYCSDKYDSHLSVEDYYTIIDKIYDTGCLFLNFTGGEIFTNKDFIDIYMYAKQKGFIIDLMTNVSLLSDTILEIFKKYPPNNIAVTIYGTSPQEYSIFTGREEHYYQVINALENLKNNHIHFVLRTVATKSYYNSLLQGDFERIAEHFQTSFKYDPIVFPKTSGDLHPLEECLSVSDIISLEASSVERTEAWKNHIACNKAFHWTCNAGFNSFAVDYKGNAFICGLYRKFPISLLNCDMEEVIIHLRKIHHAHLKIVASNECSRCENRNICKWCPAYSLIYNGTDCDKIPFFCELSAERKRAFGK